MVHNYDTVTPSTEVHFNYSLLEIGGGEQPQTDHERVPAFSFVLFSHLQLLLCEIILVFPLSVIPLRMHCANWRVCLLRGFVCKKGPYVSLQSSIY